MFRIRLTHRRRARAALACGILGLAVPVAATMAPGTAAAANHVVNVSNRADDGSPTSLRAAIDQANGAPGDTWTIQLQGGEPYVIDRDCLDGGADDNHGGDLDLDTTAQVRIQPASGQPPATIEVRCEGERAIDVTGMGRLVLTRMRITGGNLPIGRHGDQNGDLDGIDAQSGGGVRSDGTVEVVSSQFDNNRTGRGGSGAPPLFAGAGGNGASGGAGSAVQASDIVVRSSTFIGNRTGDGGPGGAGLGAGSPGGSGGAGGYGTLAAINDISVKWSVIDGNALGAGGPGGHSVAAGGGDGGLGGTGGGVIATKVTMSYTTVARNVSGDGGVGGAGATAGGAGGRGGFGGGVWAEIGSIHSSTIADNRAGVGAAGGVGPTPGATGAPGSGGGLRSVPGPGVDLSFVTVTGNTAGEGANLSVPAANVVFASIVGDPQSGTNCAVGITSLGRNAFGGDESCGGAPTDTTLGGALPLGPLADNGGTTLPYTSFGDPGTPLPTRMPLPAGALDGLVPVEDCAEFGVDQRNEPKPSGGCEPGAVEVPVSSASTYVPLTPQRVFDTREPGPLGGYVAAGDTITVPFAGVAGVPADATAVAFNLTITQSGGAGFVTAYPNGTPQPLASNLNTIRSGQDVPNFVMVPLGADGSVSFFTYSDGHLLADIAGYFVPAQVARAGRIVPMDPTRVFDTRQPGPLQGKVGAGATLTVTFDELPVEASAVVLNVTGTQADAPGYITVYPGDAAQPYTSTLNLAGAGHTAANMAIVPLGADRTIKLFSDAGAHLLADITGYVTGPDAELSGAGLTVPMDPVRVFDTRSGPAIPAGGSIHVPTAGTVGIPANASAVWLNVTAANAAGAGYITGWPTGNEQPLASMLNVTEADETRANASIMPVGHDDEMPGAISYFSDAGTHLLADAFGYLVPAYVGLIEV